MKDQIKVGLLPLYLELYDRTSPEMRSRIDGFYSAVAGKLRELGIDPVCVPGCRLKAEFRSAVSIFVKEGVCAVVTLHLAYSPSLESIDALCELDMPIIVLDTTQAFSFSSGTCADEIMYNHGIHGVQDMCNLLVRRGRKFFIVAGHAEQSDAAARVMRLCRAACAARSMRQSRVGIVGKPFEGMGDFRVPFGKLKEKIGIRVIKMTKRDMKRYASMVSEADVEREIAEDLASFETLAYAREAHVRSIRAGLLLRCWIADMKLTAFTVNFLAVRQGSSFECMPFLEAGKAMAAGIGYAGEGDVLTAALMGAIAHINPAATFTEMFCPDWQGNSIFLSHMGEMNMRVADLKPRLVEKDFPYTNAKNPVIACGRYKQGRAVLVNLAPTGKGRYMLLLAPVEVLGVDGDDTMENSVHGWVRPKLPVALFLEQYSLAGGTHHLVLVYGNMTEELAAFGDMMGFDVKILQ